jgi:hypothetical protein
MNGKMSVPGQKSVRRARGESIERVVKLSGREPALTQIVFALRSTGRFADRLDGGKEDRHQYADDGDNHQKFDQRESAPESRCASSTQAG